MQLKSKLDEFLKINDEGIQNGIHKFSSEIFNK
jgi:hypothetical protein